MFNHLEEECDWRTTGSCSLRPAENATPIRGRCWRPRSSNSAWKMGCRSGAISAALTARAARAHAVSQQYGPPDLSTAFRAGAGMDAAAAVICIFARTRRRSAAPSASHTRCRRSATGSRSRRRTCRRCGCTCAGRRRRWCSMAGDSTTSNTRWSASAVTTIAGTLWSPGYFRADLPAHAPVTLGASTESWEAFLAVEPTGAWDAELERRQRLVDQADPRARSGFGAELVLAADQFIITPTTPRRRRRPRPRRGRRNPHGDRRLSLVHRLGPRHDDQPRRADARHRPARSRPATSCAPSPTTFATA